MEKLLIEEIRALNEPKKIKAKVNDYSLSKELRGNNGKFREVIPKEVWEDAINEARELKVFINHKPYVNIVSEVELRAEDDGVYLYGTLNDSSEGVYEAIQKGELREMSFGFQALKDSWENAKGFIKRTVQKMNLLEVSLLDVEAAYLGTEIQVRCLNLPTEDIKRKRLELLKTF